jgi:hypothetical protein
LCENLRALLYDTDESPSRDHNPHGIFALNLGSTTHNISKSDELPFPGTPCIPDLRAERVPPLIEYSFESKLSEGVCFPCSNAQPGLNQSSVMARKESEVSFQPVVWGIVTKASTLGGLCGT